MFISSREYDNDLDIYNSNDPKFHMRIYKKIEPGSMKVQDSLMKNDKMFIINTRGDDFYYDAVKPDDEEIQNNI